MFEEQSLEPTSNEQSYLDDNSSTGSSSVESQVTSLDANNPDGSSPAEQGAKEPESALEAVQLALQRTNKEKPAEAPPASDKQETQGQKEGEPAKPEQETDDSRFDKHPRFQRLMQERDTFKADATGFRQIQQFVQTNGLSQQDFEQGMNIMALMKTNPVEAFKVLQPIYSQLQQTVGEVLPPDIQEKVDNGFIDEETGRDLARTRAEANSFKQRAAHIEQQQQLTVQQQQQQAHESAVNSMVQGVDAWERNWQATDPDYAKKKEFVQPMIEAAMRQAGRVLTPEEAVGICNQAVDKVNKQLSSILPQQRQDIRHVKGSAQVRTTPTPTSPLEAAKLALQQGRR